MRRIRSSTKASAPPQVEVNGNEKEMEMEKPVEEKYSAQAIIEATVPKVRLLSTFKYLADY